MQSFLSNQLKRFPWNLEAFSVRHYLVFIWINWIWFCIKQIFLIDFNSFRVMWRTYSCNALHMFSLFSCICLQFVAKSIAQKLRMSESINRKIGHLNFDEFLECLLTHSMCFKCWNKCVVNFQIDENVD